MILYCTSIVRCDRILFHYFYGPYGVIFGSCGQITKIKYRFRLKQQLYRTRVYCACDQPKFFAIVLTHICGPDGLATNGSVYCSRTQHSARNQYSAGIGRFCQRHTRLILLITYIRQTSPLILIPNCKGHRTRRDATTLHTS